MIDLLTNMINRADDNGLILFDAPTGLGKTTAAVKYIKNYLDHRESFPQQILYVTNLKKNLPDLDLQFLLKNQYEDYVLFLKPYSENIIEKWNTEIIDNRSILNSIQYKELNIDIKELKRKTSSEESDRLYCNNIKKKIAEKTEPEFRKFIKKTLLSNLTQSERKKVIKENKWLRILYPATELEKYKILLMSTDKFFSPIDTFYRLPFYFYNDGIIKKSLIFIDEFDATKNILVKHIIDDGIKLSIDIISLFLSIYHVLLNTNFPKNIFNTTKTYEENRKSDKSQNHIKNIIDKNIECFETVYKKYHMSYLLKSDENKKDKAFLFSDGNTIEVIRDKVKKKFYLYHDEKASINRVTTDKNIKKRFNLKDVILEIKKAIDYFTNGIEMIAKNYKDVKNESPLADYYTIEESIDSVVSIFNINDDMRDFIVTSLNNINMYGYLVINSSPSFINQGFMFLEIEDSNYHDFQSRIRLYQFSTTPENIMINLAKSSLIVGMSATASLNTIIGNYDIAYIKKKLNNNFIVFNDKEFQILRSMFEKTQRDYLNKKAQVKTIIIDDYKVLKNTDSINELLLFLVGDERYLDNVELNDINVYQLYNILKLAKVYVLFEKEEHQKSIVCFLNALPGYDKDFDLNILNQVLNDAAKHHNFKLYQKFVVNSVDFDRMLDETHEKIYQNERVMLITTYQTIGTGKNIQFDLKDFMIDSIISNEEINKQDKDFDSIYLQTPSNLVQYIRTDSDTPYEDLARFLFHQEYLYRNKSIQYYQFKKNIENGFRKVFYGDKYLKISNKNKDLTYHTAQVIIQAIGRICRSRNINKETTIYIDKEIVLRVQDIKDDLSKRLLNHKFISVLNTKYEDNIHDLDDFSSKNKKAHSKINMFAYQLRKNKKINHEWNRLRDFALKNPTANNVPDEYKKYYYEFDRKVASYTYKMDNKKNITRLLLDTRYDYLEVSEVDCGLSLFMDNTNLKNHFINMNYAVKFSKNKYIMLPSFYNQIYKGALGEVVGKFAVETEILGDNLEKIEDTLLFELFDFKYKDTYIDFKHWQHYDGKDKIMKKKIRDKLQKTKGKKIIVINVLKRGDHDFKVTNDGVIHKIPYLYSQESENISENAYNAVLYALL